jgi:SAM-dependent methyltransferase
MQPAFDFIFVNGCGYMMVKISDLDAEWTKAPSIERPKPVLYLDTVTATNFAQEYKRRTYQALNPQPGDWLLDVGCGAGDDVMALAKIVGPNGKVIGVDKNPTMVAEGWKRLQGSGLPAEIQLGDSHQLPFEENTFDCCRSDRAVQHMEDPLQAIINMTRVVKRGGLVVISEPDWETLVVNTNNTRLTRKIINFMADEVVRHGWIGRQLPGLFRQAGLTELSVAADTLMLDDLQMAERIWGLQRHAKTALDRGMITAAEMREWICDLENAGRNGAFFSAASGFMVRGRKP